MKTYFCAFFILLGLSPFALTAQPSTEESPKDSVQTVVLQFFEGLNEGDTALIKSCLHPEVRFFSLYKTHDQHHLNFTRLTAFLKVVGSPRNQHWEEAIENLKIEVDGGLAQVWMDYRFYLDETLSHCGVNQMTLVQDQASWLIIQIADTRRKDPCQ